ncbi:MAG: WYL domain-containing protein [Pirellulales bacterium]|nr:WYL domain-containing protein [Pirellulales bacterium]
MADSRVGRLITLLVHLQSGRGHNTSTLAETCGVSRRTIFRDLELLREAGVPLWFNAEEQRFYLTGRSLLPPMSFTPEEALALVMLCHDLGNDQGLPFCQPARSAALKLESALPQPLRDHLRQVGAAVAIQLQQVNALAEAEPVYQQLLAAIGSRRAVRIQYNSFADAERLTTKLHPYRLLFSRRSWYVVGRSLVHREIRTFNVGRIEKLEPLDERYRLPHGFSLKRYLRNAWHLIPEPGPDAEIIVRFQPLVAGNVAEVVWHPTQRLEWNADGTLDFHATVSGIHEVSWWVLGYGDEAEVLAPAALRELVAGRAERMATIYTARRKREGGATRRSRPTNRGNGQSPPSKERERSPHARSEV